ncbi:MAG: hypothetical protein OER56_01945 [Hyphomicrobiales bacterium]|nr:hypothetical protein [Hyphomicrobiales bacterium]
MTDQIKRIAMWSGPRNISTAMMYSFASRPDCAVWDEPFYAFYLKNAGITHPLNQEIIDAGEPDWDRVVELCCKEDPGKPVYYQKHMTHHMIDGYDRNWLQALDNAFLIRAPERVLASYARKRDEVTLRDIGFVEQAEIFDTVCDMLGKAPPVVDTDDILSSPETTLGKLCKALDIPFRPEMLSWQPGPKPYDGVWAAHWYNAVWQSDGFNRPPSHDVDLGPGHQQIADQARPLYEKLKAHKL